MMNPKNSFIAAAALLLTICGLAAAPSPNASPVYLYIHNPETGQCDIRDSNFRYTPVPQGTLRAMPILASVGESSARCDTIYVIAKQP